MAAITALNLHLKPLVVDSMQSRMDQLTQELLSTECGDFITKDEWVAKSPDLNPMDYRVWAMMIPKVYEGVCHFDSAEKLRERLEEVW